MEGFTRSLPSSPLLNLRLAKRTGRAICVSAWSKLNIWCLSYVNRQNTFTQQKQNAHSSHRGRNGLLPAAFRLVLLANFTAYLVYPYDCTISNDCTGTTYGALLNNYIFSPSCCVCCFRSLSRQDGMD